MRILFLCEGTTVPATRFRVEQFIPYFEARGIECVVRHAYGDVYNDIRGLRIAPVYQLAARAKRIPFAADADEFDCVFLQRPAIPQTAFPERLTHWLNPHTIFDFDDSLWLGPNGRRSKRRESAFESIVETASSLIAGNEYLAEVARRPEKTTIIPTVIDTQRYVPPRHRLEAGAPKPQAAGGPIIGWMGTSGNFPFLKQLVPSLERVLDTGEARLRLVSNAPFEALAHHPRVEQIRWSAEREIELLQSFDIGLMPLIDSPLTRGKCAFKMITYMACGAPVVVSAVGANVEVFEGSNAGFCLEGFEWDEAILDLVRSPRERRRMGESGREHVVEAYSIHAVIGTYIRLFETLATR